jgi:hypothetical protein
LKASLVVALALSVAFAAPAFAAATPAAPPKPPATPDASSDVNSDSGQPAGPAKPAPKPDPFISEMLRVCRDGASGDPGTFQRLQTGGWNLSVDGDTQTAFYQSFSGEKDFPGVGTVDMTYSFEVYPSLTQGYCSVSIDTAERKIGISDLKSDPMLKGDYRETADGVASNWQENGASPHSFIQADQHSKDLYFILDVMTLIPKPAADLKYVQPDADDGSDDSADDPSTDTQSNGAHAH